MKLVIFARFLLFAVGAEEHARCDGDDGGDERDGHDDERAEAGCRHTDTVLLVGQDDRSVEEGWLAAMQRGGQLRGLQMMGLIVVDNGGKKWGWVE
jgi:hypothetical protein